MPTQLETDASEARRISGVVAGALPPASGEKSLTNVLAVLEQVQAQLNGIVSTQASHTTKINAIKAKTDTL